MGEPSIGIPTRGYFFMFLLSLQFGIQPFLVSHYIDPSIPKTKIVAVQELMKFGCCLALIVTTGEARSAFKGWSLTSSFRVAALPAMIYAVQNYAVQLAYHNLDSLTFNLLNQTKILFTAVFVFLILGRPQTKAQSFALLLLCAAAFLLASNKNDFSENKTVDLELSDKLDGAYHEWFFRGILPCLLASILSGLASALSQRTLQSESRNSYLFSMELSVYTFLSVLFSSFLGYIADQDVEDLTGNLYQEFWAYISLRNDVSYDSVVSYVSSFQILSILFDPRWTMGTTLAILINSLGGICVGQVTKYAGGVRKAFAIIGGIIFTALLQCLVFGVTLSWRLQLAFPLTVFSLYIHSNFG